MPDDLAATIAAEPAAQAMFDVLTKTNGYALAYRIATVRREEIRRLTIGKFVATLARHESPTRSGHGRPDAGPVDAAGSSRVRSPRTGQPSAMRLFVTDPADTAVRPRPDARQPLVVPLLDAGGGLADVLRTRLNRLWVDSRVRAVTQARVEGPALRALAGARTAGRALEVGCGRRGTGIRLALGVFRAEHVDAVDLHADSVRAVRRATADLADRVQVSVGDARALAGPDAAYDTVFSYHLLHHTPHWRTAVQEAARVLRPGGALLLCDMTARFVDHPIMRLLSRHPHDGDRPTPDALADAVAAAGLVLVGQRTRYLGCWTALVAVRP